MQNFVCHVECKLCISGERASMCSVLHQARPCDHSTMKTSQFLWMTEQSSMAVAQGNSLGPRRSLPLSCVLLKLICLHALNHTRDSQYLIFFFSLECRIRTFVIETSNLREKKRRNKTNISEMLCLVQRHYSHFTLFCVLSHLPSCKRTIAGFPHRVGDGAREHTLFSMEITLTVFCRINAPA